MTRPDEIGRRVKYSDALACARLTTRDGALAASVDPTGHEFVRLRLAADYRRQAAYRRLALTILGLDVPSLLYTLLLTRTGGSPWSVVTASWHMSCDTPRQASIAPTPLG
jgi:hypothetical protein